MPETLSVNEIQVLKGRQRKIMANMEELRDSIYRLGLIHPIVVRDGNVLVAGERRLRAWQELCKRHNDFPEQIPVRHLENLTEYEAQLIELEENVKRVNLDWREHCLAIYRYLNLRREEEPDYTLEEAGLDLSIDASMVSKRCQVGAALISGEDEAIYKADSFAAALNVLRRLQDRKITDEIDILNEVDTGLEILDEGGSELGAGGDLQAAAEQALQDIAEGNIPKADGFRQTKFDIIQADFVRWVESYNDRPFNLIHCDFPYGINMQSSDQSSHEIHETYDDAPEVYWRLLGAFLDNRDRFIASSAHVVFWFSMKYYQDTVEAFSDAGFRVDPYPLIWAKSDKRGLLPDATRGPRRTYETALFMSRGDRKIIRATSNHVEAPTPGKRFHYTQKPLKVIDGFLQMLIDSTTRLLDPTCGSGTAIQSAIFRRASVALGLDISEECVITAKRAAQHTVISNINEEE